MSINIRKSFDESFDFLFKNKDLVLPFFFSFLSFFIIFLSFLFITDSFTILKLYSQMSYDYENYYSNEVLNGNFVYKSKEDFFRNHPNWEIYEKEFNFLISFENLYIFLGSIIIWFLLSNYFINVGLYSISQRLKEKSSKFSYSKSLKFYPMNLFINFLLYCILLLFFLFMLMPFLLSYFNIFFIFSIIFFFPFALWFFIYYNSKFLFAIVSLYYDEGVNNNFNSIKKSFSVTKNKFKYALLILIVIYGINYFSNFFGGQPMYSLIFGIIVSFNYWKIVIFSIIFLIILFILSYISYFLSVFKFISYKNFNK